MMVYALTLNVTAVLGGRFLSVCCVADMLIHLCMLMTLEQISFVMMTPLGSKGGTHKTSICTTSGKADRLYIGPGTV